MIDRVTDATENPITTLLLPPSLRHAALYVAASRDVVDVQ